MKQSTEEEKKDSVLSQLIRTFQEVFNSIFNLRLSIFSKLKKSADSNSTKFNKEISNNLENLSHKRLEDIMVPRSDIVAVEESASLDELTNLFLKQTYTRILVYKDHLDKIIGFVHIRDLFSLIVKSKSFNLKKLVRKHLICPDSMRLTDLLKQMQKKQIHIAVIIDEYGGTAGIVTLEDVIEEIVGDIDDEHDHQEPDGYKIIAPGLIISNARVELVDIQDILGHKLLDKDSEYDTIGGLVMARCGTVPEKGQVIKVNDDISIEILISTPRTIKQLKITYKVQ